MNTKPNIAGVLSLAVLLLLPAFAAAGQRKTVKRTVLPTLNTDNSAFQEFNAPATTDSSTTQDSDEDSALSEGQSVGGAGVVMGAPLGAGIIQGVGLSQNKVGAGAGTGGGGSGRMGKNTGGNPTPAGGSGCRTSASWNIPWSWQASDSTVTGSINTRIHLAQNQSLAIQFTTGASGQGRFSTVETADVVAAERYATISRCPGDFSVTTPGCVRNGSALTANINFIVGGMKYGYCALTPNTTYYFNIRHANPGAAAGTLVETCPSGSGCAFYLSMSHN